MPVFVHPHIMKCQTVGCGRLQCMDVYCDGNGLHFVRELNVLEQNTELN